MPVGRPGLAVNASLIIDGEEYPVDDGGDEPPVQRERVPTQPADSLVEFERRIENLALGWGASRFVGAGMYDFGDVAVLHEEGAWKPGAKVTERTHETTPLGPVSACEFWDGVDANRRLVLVSPRHIYEYDSAGDVVVEDMGSGFDADEPMTKGVRFKSKGMDGPVIFVARQGADDTDYMVERTGDGIYAVSSNEKYAAALGTGKDADGNDVLWRVDEDGKLNATIADGDATNTNGWAGSLYDSGAYGGRANDLVQNQLRMIVGRDDGAYSFDLVANAIPMTPGMGQTPSADNFRYFKDFNGLALAPTAQGLIWMDGLEWGVCGPISSNEKARNLRGTEDAVSAAAGEYVYCGVNYDDDVWIFLGRPRRQGETGMGPFSWHGPVAKVEDETVVDLHVSTVFGRRLWILCDGAWYTIDLNEDFSPVTDEAAGHVYLPEGIFDMSGPGIIADFRKAEFVASGRRPFAATNAWTIELETTPGSGSYVAIDGGVVNSGVVAERFWSTETSGKRLRGRLAYSGNEGAAELAQVIVRGTERPETTWEYTIRVKTKDNERLPRGNRTQKSRVATLAELEALVDGGRKTVVLHGESFTGQVKRVTDVSSRSGHRRPPEGMASVVIREVVTS